MAIKTKIQLANDTLGNWTKDGSRTLLSGEVALAYTDNGNVEVRVGDGTHAYSGSKKIQISADQVVDFDTKAASASQGAIDAAIAGISAVETEVGGTAKTVKTIKQENGKVTLTFQNIEIQESQVSNLVTDLGNKLEKTELSNYVNLVGLSAASSSNPVVTKTDIAALEGAMHFVGVKDAVPTDLTDYKSGDIILVGTKEYVCDKTQGKFIELGDESLYVTGAQWETWISGTFNPLTGWVNNISTDLATERGNISSLSTEVESAKSLVATETTRATGAEDAISADLTTLSSFTHGIKLSINNTESTITDAGVLSFTIDGIDCGNASGIA